MAKIKVKCRAERKLFPPGKQEDGFMLCAYIAQDASALPSDARDMRFVAKGPLLPWSKESEITLFGDQWEKKDGAYTLRCTGYDEDIPNTAAAVVSFLRTLDGCEDNDIVRMVNNAPAENPIWILEGDYSIIKKSIKNKFAQEKVLRGVELRRHKREEFFFLLPYMPKNADVCDIIDIALAAENVPSVKSDPFALVIDGGLPYRAAKNIAKANRVPINHLGGVKAAMLDVLKQGEGQSSGCAYDEEEAVGNTFLLVDELIKKTGNTVGINKNSPLIITALQELIESGHCVCAQNKYIYRSQTATAEYGVAEELCRLMDCEIPQRDYTMDIYALENSKGMRLAPEQRRAVKVALANPVTLLIGGPGTGKTTIEQFIIEVFRLYHKDDTVLLVAPTGKAARRMSESTGEFASTVHKALGVSAGAEVIETDTILDAGLILIDEASMLDTQVMFALLKAIQQGTQVVIVGDTNQLPSVGAGNVLFELINSKQVTVAALERVYRQAAGSIIAVNCARIKRGVQELDYGDTFQFIEAFSQEDAVDKILSLYQEELNSGVGIENVCLLSPYRRSTPTGVNALNKRIQSIVMDSDGECIKYGQKTFFLGDKVMMMANTEDVANGDVGYITDIENGKKVTVDFGDRQVTYNKGDLRNLDLAYGISIHKSQGTEFATCIIVMMDEHKAMLKRNLLYTAVSRAKTKVIIVGTRSALNTAIATEDVSKRQSRLGEILSIMAVKK